MSTHGADDAADAVDDAEGTMRHQAARTARRRVEVAAAQFGDPAAPPPSAAT